MLRATLLPIVVGLAFIVGPHARLVLLLLGDHSEANHA
jgi:hypothetical protein